ncbi:hypothetical protein AOLI_G00022740 [Acnodon oligacanthus]
MVVDTSLSVSSKFKKRASALWKTEIKLVKGNRLTFHYVVFLFACSPPLRSPAAALIRRQAARVSRESFEFSASAALTASHALLFPAQTATGSLEPPPPPPLERVRVCLAKEIKRAESSLPQRHRFFLIRCLERGSLHEPQRRPRLREQASETWRRVLRTGFGSAYTAPTRADVCRCTASKQMAFL